MTACMGKSCSFGLLCASFVNVYQSFFLVLRVGRVQGGEPTSRPLPRANNG